MTKLEIHRDDKAFIFTAINQGEWKILCQYLRSWLNRHCPRYRRDEVENNVGSWVSRMIIVKQQIVDKLKFFIDDEWKPLTPEEGEAEIHREIDSKWDREHEVYARRMQTIDKHPSAESYVRGTLARLDARTRKGEKEKLIDLAALEAECKKPAWTAEEILRREG